MLKSTTARYSTKNPLNVYGTSIINLAMLDKKYDIFIEVEYNKSF